MDATVGESLRSAIYIGHVAHARGGAVPNRFRYPLYYAAIDLGELDELSRRLRLFSYNRRNLFALRDRDYQGATDGGLAGAAPAFAARSGGPTEIARVVLFTQLRVCGYVFNPVSFFYCYARSGDLACIVAEVNNTYDQTHRYLLHRKNQLPDRAAPTFRTTKAMFVSPFIGDDCTYDWSFPTAANPCGDNHRIGMALHGSRGRFFTASFSGTRRALNDLSLLRTFAAYPVLPARIITLIHLQAARLKLLGLQYRRPRDERRPVKRAEATPPLQGRDGALPPPAGVGSGAAAEFPGRANRGQAGDTAHP